METNGKERNQLLDVVRGLAILVVIYGHSIQICNNMDSADSMHGLIRQFQMPLLMMVSGFSAAISRRKGFIKEILGKIDRLLVPYLAWVIIVMLINRQEFTAVTFLYSLFSSQFWFLRILFLISVIGVIVQNVVLKLQGARSVDWRTPIIITCGVIGGYCVAYMVSLIPHQESVFRFSMYYGLGFLMCRVISRLGKTEVLLAMYALAASFVILNLFFTVTGYLRFTSLVLALGGSCWIVIIAMKLLSGAVFRIPCNGLITIGQNTLPFYAIHWCLFFNVPWHDVYSKSPVGNYPWAGGIIVCLLWTVGCVIITKILAKSSLTRRILLGVSR